MDEYYGLAKIGEIISTIRAENNLPLRDFADKCIDQQTGRPLGWSTIKKIEEGITEPSVGTLRAIASNPYVRQEGYSYFKLMQIYAMESSTDLPVQTWVAEDIFCQIKNLPRIEIKKLIMLLAQDLPKDDLIKLMQVQLSLINNLN